MWHCRRCFYCRGGGGRDVQIWRCHVQLCTWRPVDSFQLVVRNDHEERKKTLLDGKEVIIGWFPFKRGKGVVCLFEETGDGVRHHGEMKLTKTY